MTIFITKFADGSTSAAFTHNSELVVVDEVVAAQGATIPPARKSERLSDEEKTVYTVEVNCKIVPLYKGEKHVHVRLEDVEAAITAAEAFGIK